MQSFAWGLEQSHVFMMHAVNSYLARRLTWGRSPAYKSSHACASQHMHAWGMCAQVYIRDIVHPHIPGHATRMGNVS